MISKSAQVELDIVNIDVVILTGRGLSIKFVAHQITVRSEGGVRAPLTVKEVSTISIDKP